MEVASVTSTFRPISLKTWAAIGFLCVAMYLSINVKWYAVFYLVATLLVLCSLLNYELNFAFYFFTLNAAATLDPRWADIALTARWVFLSFFSLKALLRWGLRGEGIADWTNFHTAVLVFLVLNSIGQLDAYYQPLSLLRTISLWLLAIGICVTLWRYIDRREKIIEWIRISMYITTVFVIMGFLNPKSSIEDIPANLQRFQGIYFNPNCLGIVLLFYIPTCFFLFHYEKMKGKKFISYFHLGACIMGTWALIRTGSRASVGGLLIATSVAMMIHYRTRLATFIGVAVLLTMIFLGPAQDLMHSSLVQSIVRQDSISTFSGRDELWRAGWDLFKKKSILGYGFGTNDIVLITYGNPALIFPGLRWGAQAHSTILRSLIESGIVGTIPLVIFIFMFPIIIVRFPEKINSKELYLLVMTFIVFIIASIGNSFMESWLLSVGSVSCFIFWWSVFMVYKIMRHPEIFINPGDTPRFAKK